MTTAKSATTTKDAVELKRCACGCNAVVKNQFAQGHDAKLKSQLLTEFDRGSEDAGEDLVHRGWRTAAELAERRPGPRRRPRRQAPRGLHAVRGSQHERSGSNH